MIKRDFLKQASLGFAATMLGGFGTKSFAAPAEEVDAVLDLSGAWRFQLDAANSGVTDRWFTHQLSDSISLPNSMDTAGKGNRNGPELALAGRLTRDRDYTGAAWYQCDIDVPACWVGSKVILYLERVHWESRAWIDDQEIGMQDSLNVYHEYDLTGKLTPGRHRLTLRVDNSMKYSIGPWAHSITDETMGNWNGIIGRIELRVSDPVALRNVRIGSDLARKILWIDGEISNITGNLLNMELTCVVRVKVGGQVLLKKRVQLASKDSTNAFLLNLPMDGKLLLWSEFTPNLYLAELSLEARAGKNNWSNAKSIVFGVREFTALGTRFFINGSPTFLRGNLTGGEFPITGHFPMDEAGWVRVIGIMKAYGLNHLRFHSHCPPEAAFTAADKLGFYFCPEAPFWTKLKGDSPEGRFMHDEAFRMIRAYGNHPSFVMMGLGNEVGGDNPFFSSILRELKQADPRRLYTCDVNDPGTGKRKSPIADCDFFVTRHTKKGGLRLAASARFEQPLSGDGTDCDYVEAASVINVPLVAHELGQWVTHPSGTEIPKYTGVMKPYNLQFFSNLLKMRGMYDQAEMFCKASGRLSWQLYKEDMELCLRTPKFGGFQLLQLQDFPGQGDALVGFLDAFWETKGILTPDEFRGVCNETVALARMPHFVWTSDQTFSAALDVAHYGPDDLKHAHLHWMLASEDGKFLKEGSTGPIDIDKGTVTHAGNIQVSFDGLTQAVQLKLTVGVEGVKYHNEWPVWVYPKNVPIDAPQEILVATSYDDAVKARLAEGGKVLLSIPANANTDSISRILRTRFKTVFWTFLWRETRHDGTMGLLCNPHDPALKSFPTDFHSNWQWAELVNGARAFVLNEMPVGCTPIVQGIDDFHRAWKLGHVVEGRVGKGSLILCGFDLHSDLEHRVVARQLRRSLLDYMAGTDFKPPQSLDLDRLFEPSLAAAGQVVFASSGFNQTSENAKSGPEQAGKSEADIIQGELNQFNRMTASKQAAMGASAAFDLNWESTWILDGCMLPQEVHVDFRRSAKLRGLLYKAATTGACEFDVYVSDSRENWDKPVAHFKAPAGTKWFYTVVFDQPQTGRYMKIVITAKSARNNELRIAEFEPLFE